MNTVNTPALPGACAGGGERLDESENGQKFNFPIRCSHANFKISQKISNLNWVLPPMRKDLSISFLISLRIIN